jgi:perosamine synthetase
VLEDCCHAFGSRYHGRLVGTLGAGGFFSAQWSKPFSTGLGGMAVINDPDLAARVRKITEAEALAPGLVERMLISAELLVFHLLVFPRTVGLATNAFRFLGSRGLLIGSSSKQELVGRMPEGYFKRLSAGQATVGCFELRRSQRNFEHRRQLTALYDRLLGEAGWPTPAVSRETQPVLVRYPLPVANKKDLLRLAGKHLVEMGDWFECPLHGAEIALDKFGFQDSRCPVSVEASRRVVNLPLHQRVSEAAARRTVEFVLRYGQRVTSDGP